MGTKKITDIQFAGFAVTAAQPGEKVKVQLRDAVTSDSPLFYVYAEQLAAILSPQLGIPNWRDIVNRYLAVIHSDGTTDVYWDDDLKLIAKIKPTRAIESGEVVYAKDIETIEDLRFPGVTIGPTDSVIFLARSGWRFAVFYDCSGHIDLEAMATTLGRLQATLVLEDVLKRTLSQIAYRETEAAKSGAAKPDAFIITEGKTDWMHLERAFRNLGYARQLEYSKVDKELGDSGLIDICRKAIHMQRHDVPVICIFDRDNQKILKELIAQSGSARTNYQSWGNNVFSLALPHPEFRSGYLHISIEMLYPDDILRRTTVDGKRLFFDNEVKIEALAAGGKLRAVVTPPDAASELKKKVYSTDVDDIEDGSGRKAAISKTAFAEMIYRQEHPFRDVPFGAFGSIAAVLDEILAQK